MIDELRTAKTANFYTIKRRLSNRAVDELFRLIRAVHPSASQNLFLHRREEHHEAKWSAISFLYDRKPSFLIETTAVRERVCGFMLLIEYAGHLAVLKSRLDLPSSFASRHLGRVAAERVDAAVAKSEAVFERIRLRNMSVSKLALRTKTLESSDLANAVGPASSSRYVPQAYAVRSGSDHYAATPSTGRIAQRSDRIDHLLLVEFARAVIDELQAAPGEVSPFIRNFARAIDLASVEGQASPTVIAFDAPFLAGQLFDERRLRLVRPEGEGYAELTHAEAELVLGELDRTYPLRGKGKMLDIMTADEADRVGGIAVNKARIALRSLDLPLINGIGVEAADRPLGEDPERTDLRTYLEKNDLFIILFDQLSLAYIDGTLFRDEAFASGGGNFLRYFRAEPSLAAVTDEKGNFAPQQTAFDADSTFGVISATIAADDDLLVCDDLDDEWADFIGVQTNSNPARITFYHGKHGNLSLGAGPFHVSVSQALKNLGRMALEESAVAPKLAGWNQNYRNGGVQTAIARVVHGDPAELENILGRARSAPDALRRVCIVTSSLSLAALQQALDDVAAGTRPSPYFVQLYWLLLSFFSACSEVGAFGYVICQP